MLFFVSVVERRAQMTTGLRHFLVHALCANGSQHSGSSLSLASTKVCSSMDEGDGPGSEAELMEDCPQVPASIAERYKVGRMIGDGNFAVVRECVERSTGREYALKIINKSKCRGKEHMIQNEVSILRRVKHPNIVLLIEEMDTYSELYMVMELVKVKHPTFMTVKTIVLV
uniref:Protein kinase domain-containing protein n=1 Tax=Sinocyclocheilus grahami TaxID=75366 RepID=A0A672K514_SINGR